MACIASLAPVTRSAYGIGPPSGGSWRMLLDTAAEALGGSGAAAADMVSASGTGLHGFEHSAQLTLPPLGVLWLCPDGQ